MLLFYKCDVVTLGKLFEPVSRHYCRCCNIEKEFSSIKYKIFTCFPHFIPKISIYAREYKSVIMNSNTQIFNSINSAYIHCIAEIFTQLFQRDNEATM